MTSLQEKAVLFYRIVLF